MIFIVVWGFFWFVSALFGNEFLKLNFILGINPLYAIIFFGWIGVAIVWTKNPFYEKTFTKCVNQRISSKYNIWILGMITLSLIFITYMIAIIVTSYINIPDMWGIVDISYNSEYIPRQCYVWFFIPWIYLIARFFPTQTTIVGKKKIIWILVILSLITIIAGDSPLYRSLIFLITSLLYIVYQKKLVVVLVLLFNFILSFQDMTYCIAIILCGAVLFVGKGILFWVTKRITLLSYIAISVMFVCLLFFHEQLASILAIDDNTLWRFKFWVNDFRNLAKTFFMGIGYGTGYASNSIFKELYPNAEPLLRMQDGIPFSDSLFVTTQHSSLINLFYRTGLIGGCVFVSLIIRPIEMLGYLCFQEKKKDGMIYRFAISNLIYNMCVIFFNPGLESPRFSIGFIASYGIAFGVIYNAVYRNRSENCDR